MKKMIPVLTVLGGMSVVSAIAANSETPLAKMFAKLTSDDPAVRATAQSNVGDIVDEELPTIEKDTAVLCNALSSKYAYARLQSAALLATIVEIAPVHSRVVTACIPGLLQTAADHGETKEDLTDDEERNKVQLRVNSLYALAMLPGGPPPEAHQALLAALGSPIARIAGVGAQGLIREKDANQGGNHELVKEALLAASDREHKVDLLSAIAAAGTPSAVLYEASHRLLFDATEPVQLAAIQAMVITAVDKAELNATMRTIAESPIVSHEVKMNARGIIHYYGDRP